jgi:hypothetical protein
MEAVEYNDPRLKDRRVPRAARALAVAAAILALLLGIASLPWRGDRPAAPPRLVLSAGGAGPLSAGAAEVRFELPDGAPLGGFARLSWASRGVRDPTGARAIVLSVPGASVALVSAELVLVPAELVEDVRARVADLGLSGLVAAATHTHAGPGGFWHNPVGERAGTGPFDPALRERIAAALADAVRRAAAAAVPVRIAAGRGRAEELVRSRSGGERDGSLDVLRLERADGGGPVAELIVFPSHPTMLGKRNRMLSGDWPSRLLAAREHGVRVFLQGSVGDQSVAWPGPGPESPEAYGDAVSRRVDGVELTSTSTSTPTPVTLAYAEADVVLPPVSPGALPAWLRPAARTLAGGLMPAGARVGALRLGPALLVFVPGEPVATVGAAWRSALGGRAVVVGLAGGYLGYVERADRVARREGETVRTYYGPDLADRLGAGALAAARATERADR